MCTTVDGRRVYLTTSHLPLSSSSSSMMTQGGSEGDRPSILLAAVARPSLPLTSLGLGGGLGGGKEGPSKIICGSYALGTLLLAESLSAGGGGGGGGGRVTRLLVAGRSSTTLLLGTLPSPNPQQGHPQHPQQQQQFAVGPGAAGGCMGLREVIGGLEGWIPGEQEKSQTFTSSSHLAFISPSHLAPLI